MDKKIDSVKSRELADKIIKFKEKNNSAKDLLLVFEFTTYLYENGYKNIPEKFNKILNTKI